MSWYDDDRLCDQRWAEPHDLPRECYECKFCYDIGIPPVKLRKGETYGTVFANDGGVCVKGFSDSNDFEQLRYVDFNGEACDEFEEA